MLSAWLAADPGRANVLLAVAVLGWIVVGLVYAVVRQGERETMARLDDTEEQMRAAVATYAAATFDAEELQLRGDRLQRERDEALAKVEHFEAIDRAAKEWRLVGITRVELQQLEAAAAREAGSRVQVAAYRKALERIADGHLHPKRCAAEALNEERRRAWATN